MFPKKWKGPQKPVVIHLAGTGDHVRPSLVFWPLSRNRGVAAADTILFRPVPSWTSSSVVPIALMSRLTQSVHLSFGFLLLLQDGRALPHRNRIPCQFGITSYDTFNPEGVEDEKLRKQFVNRVSFF